MLGHIVVDHVGDAGDVEPPGGDVGGHQDGILSGTKPRQGLIALTLGSVGMHHAHGMGQVGEAGGDTVRTHFGPAEDDDALVVGFFQQAEKEFVLLIGSDGVEGVADGFRGGAPQPDFDGQGIPEHPGGESFDFRRDGGGKKQGLPFGRAETDDFFHVGKKTHVEHAVHLVQNEVGEVGEMDFALIHEVQQSARGGHENIHPAGNLLPLVAVTHASVDQADPQARVFGKFTQGLGNLIGQFPGGLKDEGTEPSRFFQVLQNGQGEGGGFAGAGLSRADDIPSGQGDGNGLGLNRGGLLKTKFFDGLEDGRSQLQRRKSHHEP